MTVNPARMDNQPVGSEYAARPHQTGAPSLAVSGESATAYPVI
jgi:hypothetical protein